MNFKIECDGEKTRIFLGGMEITNCVNSIELKCDSSGLPEISMKFYPISIEGWRWSNNGKLS